MPPKRSTQTEKAPVWSPAYGGMNLAAIIPSAIIFNMHDAFDEPKKRHFCLVAPTAPVQLCEQEFHVIQFARIRAPLLPRLHSGVVREVEGVVALYVVAHCAAPLCKYNDSTARCEYGSAVVVRAHSAGAIIIKHTVSEGEPDGEQG